MQEVVALESGGAAIQFSGQCPYSGVQGTDMQGASDRRSLDIR